MNSGNSKELPKERYRVGDPRKAFIQMKITGEGRDFIHVMAAKRGKTVVGYLRELVRKDAEAEGMEIPVI